ncbi:MAG: hypothetical protein H6Q72_4134 [Firmicutes bacterium]|nr:hypothetical protein [Bacillota bacterium]
MKIIVIVGWAIATALYVFNICPDITLKIMEAFLLYFLWGVMRSES